MIYMVSFASSSMGNYPGFGFFLAQLCLDTQDRGKIGKNVSFASSSIPRKTMVEMLYDAPQWKFPKLGKYLEELCLHTLELGGILGRIHCLF